MTDLLSQIIGGFIGGLVAGLIGYTVDMAVGAIFSSFGAIKPLFIILGFVYAALSFLIGLGDAYVGGIFFSLGIMALGYLLHDGVTFVGGIISFGGLLFSLYKCKNRESD